MNGADTKLKKLLKLTDQSGLNGFMIYSKGVCNILSPSYLHYFAEFRPMGTRNAAVVSRSGKAALLVEPPWDVTRAASASWIKDVRGTKNFVKDLIGIMREFKISGPLGVAGSKEMTQEVYSAIEKEADPQMADALLEEMATEKTEREIEVVRKVAGIADVGSEAFVAGARVGIREYELVAELEFAMRSAGADDIFILIGSGRHNHEMHEPTDRRLRDGDVIIGEITPVYDGQFIQVCRTVVLGKPNPVLFEKYDILKNALDASFGAMKSGVSASVITLEMNRVISEAGYGKYCQPPYMRSRGHGFAVGSIAPGGELSDKMQVRLQRHQVIAVHPNQYLPETGYLACGESVMVTDAGVERLARSDTKLYVKEG